MASCSKLDYVLGCIFFSALCLKYKFMEAKMVKELASEDSKFLEEHINKAYAKLGVSKSIFTKGESDWAYVIKLHSLTEAAIESILADKMGRKYKDIFSKMNIGNYRYGKIAFLKAGNMVKDWMIDCFLVFTELRNRLAHNIELLSFSFSSPGDVERKIIDKMNDTVPEEDAYWPDGEKREGEKLILFISALFLIRVKV